ncbi:hypothetical protein [Ferrovibrio sp.]|uniref:hypothetical protein n=1 Tax=Ferrovibrio sp. TaxID=1917215 RepID=UPI0035B14C52
MSATEDFSAINAAKADFSSIYVQPDPRSYFRTLGALGYSIPHLARPIFEQLIEARQRAKGGPITVLDLGCSYGINAALMKYRVSYDQLTERYDSLGHQPLEPAQLLEMDRHYYASWPKRRDITVIGLDISEPAIRYAQGCGMLDIGFAADLENQAVPPEMAAALAKVDLIVSTGCVGYVTQKTFEKLALCAAGNAAGMAPWVASFVLRMFDYGEIAATLQQYGLVTEKFEGASFVQRRFRDEEEMRGTLDALAQRGISPTAKEAEGLFHAELFCSRPEAEIRRSPINKLVSVSSGMNRNYGRRPRLSTPRAASKPKSANAGKAMPRLGRNAAE